MGLKESPLYPEVALIIEQAKRQRAYGWRIEFITPEGRVVPMRLTELTIERGYNASFGDKVTVEVFMGVGSMAFKLYPYRDNLKAILSREPLNPTYDGMDLSDDIEGQVLKAVPLLDSSPVVMHQYRSVNAGELDMMDQQYYRFQLLDMSLEQIRMMSVGGVYVNISGADLVRHVLTDASARVKLDEQNTIVGVDMAPPSLEEKLKQIVVPHGTHLTELPDYIFKNWQAFYNAGMGFFLQRKHWYVYPLYDITRYDKAESTMTFINIPSHELPQMEVTYRKTPNQTIALVTGDVDHLDTSFSSQANEGNGVRFADAKQFMETHRNATADNKTELVRAETNSEYVAFERDDKLVNAHISPDGPTANPFLQHSAVAARNGSRVMVVWQNSDPGSITPGKPVRFMYMEDRTLRILKGTILHALHTIQTNEPGMTSRRHVSTSAVTLHLERPPRKTAEAT